ncbi:fluoride efflux transporter FluC [Marininema halotolerans]|uniref:Fluoride-specific ion channel FluC n=1 Tax=Marininema halotolerans TaxID=1155944 RepID=A0A1I6R2A7_9BACL|nr:CrcB family protein [Marininema halotolerans]SFS58857.1 CrcB protein [Marininema halotolerans]
MILSILEVALGGFIGSLTRYFLGRLLNPSTAALPWGTFIANCTGSFLLGWVYGDHPSSDGLLFLGTGFMGSFTTFSTFYWELHRLTSQRKRERMFLYLGLTYSIGILLAYLGFLLGKQT